MLEPRGVPKHCIVSPPFVFKILWGSTESIVHTRFRHQLLLKLLHQQFPCFPADKAFFVFSKLCHQVGFSRGNFRDLINEKVRSMISKRNFRCWKGMVIDYFFGRQMLLVSTLASSYSIKATGRLARSLSSIPSNTRYIQYCTSRHHNKAKANNKLCIVCRSKQLTCKRDGAN
jgi:hypothetical protein